MRDHHILVMQLIDADPHSAEAARLRGEIQALHQKDPTLIAEYIGILAAHVPQVGEVAPADRVPEGILLT